MEMTDKTIDNTVDVGVEETTEDANSQEKKYTDADLDRIIGKRLAREREKVAKAQEEEKRVSDLDIREKELEKRELKADARDALSEKGLPKSLADLLDYGSKESYEASLARAEEIVQELHDLWEIKRATGRTPKAYGNSNGIDPIGEAFRSR